MAVCSQLYTPAMNYFEVQLHCMVICFPINGLLSACLGWLFSTEACQYIIEDSSAAVVVVENSSQLGKILQVSAITECPTLLMLGGSVHSYFEVVAGMSFCSIKLIIFFSFDCLLFDVTVCFCSILQCRSSTPAPRSKLLCSTRVRSRMTRNEM